MSIFNNANNPSVHAKAIGGIIEAHTQIHQLTQRLDHLEKCLCGGGERCDNMKAFIISEAQSLDARVEQLGKEIKTLANDVSLWQNAITGQMARLHQKMNTTHAASIAAAEGCRSAHTRINKLAEALEAPGTIVNTGVIGPDIQGTIVGEAAPCGIILRIEPDTYPTWRYSVQYQGQLISGLRTTYPAAWNAADEAAEKLFRTIQAPQHPDQAAARMGEALADNPAKHDGRPGRQFQVGDFVKLKDDRAYNPTQIITKIDGETATTTYGTHPLSSLVPDPQPRR